MIDGDEIAEPAGQPVGFDGRRLVFSLNAWPDHDLLMLAALLGREKCNERIVKRRLLCFGEDLLRRTVCNDFAVIHGRKPIEAARFVHVGRCHEHAH